MEINLSTLGKKRGNGMGYSRSREQYNPEVAVGQKDIGRSEVDS